MVRPLSATKPRTAAVLAPLLSMVIFSGTSCDGAFKEPACRRFVAVSGEQEVNRLTELVDGTIQVLPLAADEDIGLVDPPGCSDGALALTKHRGKHRQHLQRPAMNSGVVDQHAACRAAALPKKRVLSSTSPVGRP